MERSKQKPGYRLLKARILANPKIYLLIHPDGPALLADTGPKGPDRKFIYRQNEGG